MRSTMKMVRRLMLLAAAATGLLVVTSQPAQAMICEPRCCWSNSVHGMSSAPSLPDATESVVPAPGRPAPQGCEIQHCEPVLRH